MSGNIEAMSGEPTHGVRRLRLLAGVVAASVVACSSGVDGFHLAAKQDTKGNGGGSSDGGGSSTDETGGASESGGDGNGGDGGNVGTGASGGDRQTSSGGRGNDTSAGGSTLMTSGGASNGGASNGGASNGGAGTGGAGNGGTGAGGKGSGGVGTGGVGAGGKGSGGTGTGGTVGTGPIDPVAIHLSADLTNITAGAWDGTHFYLLQAASKQFYEVNPMNGAVSAARPLFNTGTVAPLAFAASASWIYSIVGTKAFRVPHTGWTNEAGVTIAAPTSVASENGAYAGGYFLNGDFSNSGTRAAQLLDSSWTLSTAAKNLGAVYAVASDGNSFAFTKLNVNHMEIHAVAAASTFTLNTKPCSAGSAADSENPVSVFGSTVAWAVTASQSMLLNFATVSEGVCTPTTVDLQFGNATNLTTVALIDETHALVVERLFSGNADIAIQSSAGGQSKQPLSISMGASFVTSFVVGPPHYAFAISGNVPTLITF